MHGYMLGPDGFAPGEHADEALQSEDVRVEVEFACLEPDDLRAATAVCPGGGLVGNVIECGDAATALLGARVLVAPVVACGECHTCRRGAAPVCPQRRLLGRDHHGGCATSVVCAGRWLTRLEDPLLVEGPSAALLAGPALRAYALSCRAGLAAGDVAIVLGEGPTGGILEALATSRGTKVVHCGSSTKPATAEAIAARLTELDCADRPQKIFVCDGEAHLDLAIQLAHPGSIIASAVNAGDIDTAAFFAKELTLLSVSYGHPDLIPETAALVVKGELDLSDFVVEAPLGPTSPDASTQAFAAGKCLVVRH